MDPDDVEGLAVAAGGDRDSRCQKHYTILNEEKIRQLQHNDIAEVCSLLSVSRSVVCTLLLRNNWNKKSVLDEWFANKEKAREEVGLFPGQESLKPSNNLCKICFGKINSQEKVFSCPCGHPFCPNCWKNYITVSINEGPACLLLRCPEPNCKANVGPELVDSLVSEEEKDKYNKYFLRSYVDGHWNIKWCPGPGCDRAVQIDRENYDVTCDCSYRFCWNCLEERHHPVDCKIVREWIKLSSCEWDSNTWIMAFTKPCPKCGTNIEKNQGCNHMTCRNPCNFEFCWLCLSPWKCSHSCNKYVEKDNEILKGSITRVHLRRYRHNYERWASNHRSMETALYELRNANHSIIRMLANVQNVSNSEFRFVIEALEQIVECRSILKWSYAYGYYLSMMGNATNIELFEDLQGWLRVFLRGFTIVLRRR